MSEQELDPRLRLQGRTRRWIVLLILLLLFAIFVAAQMGFSNTRPDNVEVLIMPQDTADYGPWNPVVIRRVDPAIGTLIAQDFLATAIVSGPLTEVPDNNLTGSTLIANVASPTPLPPEQATQAAVSSATNAAEQTALATDAAIDPTPTLASTEAAQTATEIAAETATSVVETATAQVVTTATSTEIAAQTATADAATATAIATLTNAPTQTPIATTTPVDTLTPVATDTPDATATPVATATNIATTTPIASATPVATSSPTFAPTQTPLPTNTPVPTNTPLPLATNTPAIPPPVAAFTSIQLTTSPPFQVNFTNFSSGTITAYNWSFGDGVTSTAPSPTHFYATAGTYAVTLTVAGPGGTNSVIQNVTVSQTFQPPTANFTTNPTPPEGDAPFTVAFTNTSSGTIDTYNWTFGDGATSNEINPGYVYANAGTYTVTLSVSGPGGVDSFSQQVRVFEGVTAGFTFAQSPGTFTVNFTNTSTGNITGYNWTFGDGATSVAVNPSRTYAAAGTYNVTLTANGPTGTDSITQSVTVVAAPTAAFTVTPTTTTIGSPVTITNNASGSITTTSWTFGDGGTFTGANPGTYTYTTAGTFTITQTVTGPGGTSTASQTVTVEEPVAAAFSLSPNPAGINSPVSITNNSTGTITSYNWDFGDGDTATGPNPATQQYATAGTYTVTLTVTGPSGTDTATQTIDIVDAPVASFIAAPANTSRETPITIANNSTGTITSYSWTFGDGGTSNLQNPPPYSYSTEGNYTIILTVTGPGGTDTATQMVQIVNTPGASFTFNQVSNAIRQVNFNNTSTVPGGTATYAWDFDGNGTVDSTAANPTFDYPAVGTYNVTLTVTGPGGNDSVTLPVPVVEAAFAATPVSVAVNELLTLTNSSTGPITSYTWDFGDTNTSTLADPGTHTYTALGNYTITLQVFSATGDFHETTQMVSVFGPPDVRVALDRGPLHRTEGGISTVTITVFNDGPSAATGITMTMPSPPNLILESNAPDQGTYAADVWNVGTLDPGTNSQIVLRYRVGTWPSFDPPANAERTYTATVTLNENDPNLGNNTASGTIRISESELSTTMAVDNPTPTPGENVVYTITVPNIGDREATNVQITTNITTTAADNVIYVSDDSGGQFDGTTGIWSIPSIPADTTATINITALVDPGITDTAVTKNADITAVDQYDGRGGNNDSQVSIFIEVTDLRINKTVSNNAPLEGDPITYTLTVRNVGLLPDTNVNVVDNLPAGVTYVSDDSGGAYDVGTGIWTIGNIAAGANATLIINVTVDPVTGPTSVTNTATVTGDRVDYTPGNNTNSATFTVATADLTVTKTASPTFANIGDAITYTITVNNTGPNPATGVVVNDLLTPEVVYVSDDSGGTYNVGTGDWTVGTIASGGSATLEITTQINNTVSPGNSFTNTAQVTAQDQYTTAPGAADSATVSVAVVDLQMTKTVNNAAPNLGQPVTYTLTVTNTNATYDATGVVVEDILPTGAAYVSDTSGGAYNSGTGIWTIGTVPAGGNASIDINVTVSAPAMPGDTVTNTATITAVDQADSNPGNDTDSAAFTIPGVDLAVAKSVDAPLKNIGDTVIYTITVTNTGAFPATNVTIVDNLPSQIDWVSDDSGGAFNTGTGVWTIGTIGATGTATLNITGTVNNTVTPGSTVPNTASLNTVTEADTNAANNISSVGFEVPALDLSMNKTANTTTANIGDQVVYTLTVTNTNGLYSATNVQVTDLLPAEVTYISDSSGGAYNVGTGIWDVGPIGTAPTGIASITITVEVNVAAVPGSTVTNTASITGLDQADTAPGNDSSSASFTVPQVDVEVTKIIDNTTPNRSDPISYTVTVRNTDPVQSATGIQVTDLLPAGANYVIHTVTQGTYTPGTGLWDVGLLAPNGAATLTLDATVDAAVPSGVPVTNTATITALDQADPNNSNDTASATFTLAQADLELGALVPDNPNPFPGETVTYTATLTNNGPQDATNITVAGFSATDNIAFLGTGTNTTITLIETIPASATPGNQTYAAEVVAVDQVDPDSTPASGGPPPVEDDYQEVIVNVQPAVDVGVIINVDNAAPATGTNVVYTINTDNLLGPVDATNVSVTITLPAGVTYFTDDGLGAYDDATGIWTIGTITAGNFGPTLSITATVTATSGQTETANASITADETDIELTNNTSAVQFTVP